MSNKSLSCLKGYGFSEAFRYLRQKRMGLGSKKDLMAVISTIGMLTGRINNF